MPTTPRLEAHFADEVLTDDAVRSAIEDGAELVELDVQLTADGKLLVFHDYTLPDGRWVHETDFVGCSQTIRDADSQTGRSAERILSLTAALDLVGAHAVGVTLDLKSGMGPEHALHVAVADIVRRPLPSGHEIHASDWDHAGVGLLKQLVPQIVARGALRGRPVGVVQVANAANLDGLNLAWDCVRVADVEALHQNSYVVAFFGGWGDRYMAHAVNCAADIVTCDLPLAS